MRAYCNEYGQACVVDLGPIINEIIGFLITYWWLLLIIILLDIIVVIVAKKKGIKIL
jgi:hypothetical protein